ncbi:hypothetical protein AB5J62_37565 [Amycolatopsis sp. cg5]|uniref:hypothetical protein n=1 Tax=Amycolatopsis sp. cg5 TaxID=3238802 RepID=UPI003523F0BD
MYWDASGIAGLIFVVVMAVVLFKLFRKNVRSSGFQRSGAADLARANGWNLFQEYPPEHFALEKSRFPGDGREVRDYATTPYRAAGEYIGTGLEGTYHGFPFTAYEYVSPRDRGSRDANGNPVGDTVRSAVIVHVSQPLPDATIEYSTLHYPTKTKAIDSEAELTPEFQAWFADNHRRFNPFRAAAGMLSIETNDFLDEHQLMSTLDFLTDVATALPLHVVR